MHVLSDDTVVVDQCPRANLGAPANNGVVDTCVVVQVYTMQHHRVADAHAITDFAKLANGHIGANLASLSYVVYGVSTPPSQPPPSQQPSPNAYFANLCSGVHYVVADKGITLGQCLGGLATHCLYVQLEASQVVFGLPNIHPIPLEVAGVQ